MTYPPNIIHSSNSITRGENSVPTYFMQVGGQLYGPYSASLMEQYCDEGRLGPQSLISNRSEGVFKPAIEWPEFRLWSKGRFESNIAPTASSAVETNPTQQTTTPQKQSETATIPSVFFIIAKISPPAQPDFFNTLKSMGQVYQISDTAWILGTAYKIEIIRQNLSETLTLEDHLFIHDSFSNRAGWFNLGEALGDNIRNLWINTAQARKSHRNF